MDKLEKENSPKIHIVFDIDDVLATGFEQDIQTLLVQYPYLIDFKNKNLLIEAIIPHMFHPGAVELLRWIFTIPNINVSFFSAGQEKRNLKFVEELLKLALGDDYDSLKDDVSVYSRHHLKLTKKEEADNQFKLFKIYYGEDKKDLTILKLENLDNVILIDDDSTYIAYGQERNMLVVPYTDDASFRHFHSPKQAVEMLLKVNRIFYIAGLLKKILEIKSESVADNLFNLQYKLGSDGVYERDLQIHNDHQYYLDGREELQKVNPELKFYGGDMANEYFHIIKTNSTMTSLR